MIIDSLIELISKLSPTVSAAFTPKTKVVIINTPHNPSGKCFTREELTKLAEICTKHNVLVLADEVVSDLFFEMTC